MVGDVGGPAGAGGGKSELKEMAVGHGMQLGGRDGVEGGLGML